VPTIRDLRRRVEQIRQTEIERYASRLGLDAEQSEAVERLTRGIVNKIMHEPISRLRDETDREAGLARLEQARSLFGLDDGERRISPVDGRRSDQRDEPSDDFDDQDEVESDS
jgi:glutamyl-tRNA reductase